MDKCAKIVQELLRDEYFFKLIIDPDEASKEFWRRWANKSKEHQEAFQKAKEVLLPYTIRVDDLSVESKNQLWAGIEQKMFHGALGSSKFETDSKSSALWYRIAAAVLVLIFAIYSFFYIPCSSDEVYRPIASIVEKVSPDGKIFTYRFSDGTKVNLFPGSKIRFRRNFGANKREVYVNGEAFFDVAKDPKRPFVVNSNNFRTTALGTSFNVRTFSGDKECEISLVTGKVRVERLNSDSVLLSEVLLNSGEEAIIHKDNLVKQSFSVEAKTAWKDGTIYLNKTSFEDVLVILDRWFSVDFVVENSWKAEGKKGTGEFKNQSLENILEVLSDSFKFKFRIIDEKNIEIRF